MSNLFERASARELELREDALAEHRRRSPPNTHTVDDSAEFCQMCEEPIPQGRREAEPGCQLCVDCKSELERELARNGR